MALDHESALQSSTAVLHLACTDFKVKNNHNFVTCNSGHHPWQTAFKILRLKFWLPVTNLFCNCNRHTGLLFPWFLWLALNLSVATVTTDAFQKRLNYKAKEISQNREDICADKIHQKPEGHILSQKNRTAISHAIEWSWVWSQIRLNFVTAP